MPLKLIRSGTEAADRTDEKRLLAALSRGDRQAAERLAEGSYRQIYAALHRMTGGDADLAADLTQETYRKAWAALAGFSGRSSFTTWLYRIAYTTFLNHVRRPRLLTPVEDPQPGNATPDPGPDPEKLASATRQAEQLRRAVLQLPEDLRFTVTARFWGELPVRDIAHLENVTTVAIRKRLKRALDLLALSLADPPREVAS